MDNIEDKFPKMFNQFNKHKIDILEEKKSKYSKVNKYNLIWKRFLPHYRDISLKKTLSQTIFLILVFLYIASSLMLEIKNIVFGSDLRTCSIELYEKDNNIFNKLNSFIEE